ncbi:MAG: glycosyl hydrolase, partial [Bacteroidota bacterium]
MRNLSLLPLLFLLLTACDTTPCPECPETTVVEPTADQLDFLGITNADHLSAASKRALEWPEEARRNTWFVEYRVEDLKGDLAYEEGIVRRDPSAVLKIDDLYYVWYTRSTGPTQGFGGDIENEKVFPWDRCDIW